MAEVLNFPKIGFSINVTILFPSPFGIDGFDFVANRAYSRPHRYLNTIRSLSKAI